ncbi:transcriptional regulator, LysR family [Shewanella halifaxensis HAW-EB4]|uniref:Transcriptional regulator, LysR family n=1 Tax=Shewanella halifaxensis (strain HAW-EB4) TaxID=458817 RepID=B0TMQ2_SHEHH|nr:LysR family transcriptional regulator [Shewanella halifaxensis]ABZ77412.1 transcriptional regulator, LysR family [Shewanella halifaxensis HAW-EB4]
MKNNLDELDLNLLKLLKVVVETGKTQVAAEQLGISQTSVSRGLAKLRETFGDQLFIRKAHGVEPSELAEKLADAADEMLNPVKKVMQSYHSFDPMKFDSELTIAMNIYFLELFGDGIFTALKQALPNAKFKLVYWQEETLSEMLNGHVDYMIHFSAFPLPQEIYQHKLQGINLCLVARKNHPVLTKSCEWEDIHHLPLARLIVDGINTKRSPIEEIYLAKGYQATTSLLTHSARVLLNQLKHSDDILFGSSYMTALDDEVATYPLPLLPKELRNIQVNGGYLQTKRGFPLNQLLHQTMQTFFDGVTQPKQ